jgi:hypothetical protein
MERECEASAFIIHLVIFAKNEKGFRDGDAFV